ncbi:MAG: sulfur oxidation c-type cytochrome SoxA [Methylococcaceae bacterium]
MNGRYGLTAGFLLSLKIALPLTACLPSHAWADPVGDRLELQQFFKQRFPQLQRQDFAEGVYAIDPIARQSWLAIEEFPPYEPALDAGKKLYNQPFANGHRYADCFPNQGIGIAQLYPKWDAVAGEVITLEKALNDCRVLHDQAPLPYQKGDIASILAYMAYTSRGNAIKASIPSDDPRALAAYEQGKRFYYTRRGQLNFSCASCHNQNAGKKIRSEILSPVLGHTSHWPVYRLAWGEMGTLHRRFNDCFELLRMPLLPAQGIELRNLEYFLSFMDNGIALNGPSTRK